MQRIKNRIKNHLGIGGRGAGAGCGGSSWCGVAAAVPAVQSLPVLHQHYACTARAILVCCAGKDLQESHLHPRSHSHESSSDFKVDANQQGVIGCTLEHGRFWKSFHPSSLIQVVVSIRPSRHTDISEIGRAGSRACAAARPRGQVWRPWRCTAACKNAISRRAWGARPGQGHLPLRIAMLATPTGHAHAPRVSHAGGPRKTDAF